MRMTGSIVALGVMLVLQATAQAVEPIAAGLQTDWRLTSGLFSEGARDLGLGDAASTTEGFVDAQGALYWSSGTNWAALFRGQGFLPTGELVVTDENRPRESKSYARLRELWFEYNGFTSYPGELLRVGLQRVRDPDGQWFDRNIESVRWIFDTTLIQGHIGAGQSFKTWRSDRSEPDSDLRDRTYVFGGLGTQWRAGHFLGARVMHAFDHGHSQREIDEQIIDPKLSDRRLTWLDAYAHNGFYDRRDQAGWSYWVDASALVGTREDYQPGTDLTPTSRQRSDVRAWATDLGLRWRLPVAMPLNLGGGYSFASGGAAGDPQDRYEQTGLHSNLSRFTGTRSQIYRYSEVLQPDLSNLHVGTVYLSVPAETWDASLIYSKFARHRADDTVILDGVDIQPGLGRKVIGDTLDLVVAYYFQNPVGRGHSTITAPQENDDLRSNIRLRLSGFKPGAAYVDAADDQYRVRLELTLWF